MILDKLLCLPTYKNRSNTFDCRTPLVGNEVIDPLRANSARAGGLLRPVFSILATALILAQAGCSKLSDFEQITAMGETKAALLDTRLDQFRKAVYWNAFDQIGQYIDWEERGNIMLALQQSARDEKVVEITIGATEFSKGGSSAEVELNTRFFKTKASNYIELRKDKQVWKYHRFKGGWLLHKSELMGPAVVDSSSFAERSRASFSPSLERQ